MPMRFFRLSIFVYPYTYTFIFLIPRPDTSFFLKTLKWTKWSYSQFYFVYKYAATAWLSPFLTKPSLVIGFHRGDDIHRLGRRNLVASDSSPKGRRQSIPTTCRHSVLNSFRQKGFISIGGISKVIVEN